jgi:hypothetical protein
MTNSRPVLRNETERVQSINADTPAIFPIPALTVIMVSGGRPLMWR